MDLSFYLPRAWSDAFSLVTKLPSLQQSRQLDDAHNAICSVLNSPFKTVPINRAIANIIQYSMDDDMDDHVRILAESIIMAAHGDTWKLERYLLIRGIKYSESYPQCDLVG